MGSAPLFWWGTVDAVGGLAGLSYLAGLLAVVALVPPLRRWAFAVLWTIVTPHRIRVALAQAGLVSRNGKLPTVLLTRRKPYGERVFLWCPDEVRAPHVAAAQSVLVTVCWARDIHVYETRGQYSKVIAVDVVRQEAAVVDARERAGPALRARFERHDGTFEGFDATN